MTAPAQHADRRRAIGHGRMAARPSTFTFSRDSGVGRACSCWLLAMAVGARDALWEAES
jgi:hypothetical protein